VHAINDVSHLKGLLHAPEIVHINPLAPEFSFKF
jgi:hypothetical protein